MALVLYVIPKYCLEKKKTDSQELCITTDDSPLHIATSAFILCYGHIMVKSEKDLIIRGEGQEVDEH